jgi:ATP-dependent Clp protease ATP-binding subunit ClpC
VEKLSDNESVRMQNLEEILHNRIIGQDQAVVSVSKALRRARVGLKNPSRPIASLLFCGPTGVGKTELCKALSEAYFGKEDAMSRLDMSEFMERHSVSKLIGSPAGYVGYGDENQLTDRIRRKPYTLILFDEIEKAHSDVLNVLLQIMDDGCLTDATGRRVSFKNALIILTSNTVARTFELRQVFSPEFLNRLDEIIPFSPLSKDEVADIAELEFAKTAERVKDKGVSLTLSAAFKDEVIDQGFDAAYGARSLRRTVVKLLDDELANSLLEQPFAAGEHVYVDVDDGRQIVVVRDRDELFSARTEDPEQLPGEIGRVDDKDAKMHLAQECAVDLVNASENDSVKADTESTKDSSRSAGTRRGPLCSFDSDSRDKTSMKNFKREH